LVFRPGPAHECAEPQFPSAKKSPVLSQQDSAVSVSQIDQGVVVEVVAVGRVDSHQPEPSRDGAQVHIEDESRRLDRLRPWLRRHLDLVSVARPIPSGGRLAVDAQFADLGERNTSGLHHMAQ